MSGAERLLLDTNAVIALLAGDAGLLAHWRRASWAGVSVISVIEFLCWPSLRPEDKAIFEQFLQRVTVVDLSMSERRLLDRVVEVRRTRSVKLPDAVIVASALTSSATLVTRDERLRSAAADAGVECLS